MQEQDLDLEKEKTVHSLENLQINVDAFYVEMTGLEVKLDLTIVPDIMYVNTKMVEVREASQRAQRMYLKIQRALGINQKWQLNLETTYEILSNSKLENDVDVRAGQTGDERKAIAGNQLVGYKRTIREAKNNVTLLKALNKAIDLCIKNIDRTDADIKQQSRLMEAQMRNLKSRDVGEAARDTYLRRTETDMDELEKLSADLSSSSVLVGSDDTLEPTVAGEEDLEEEETEEVSEDTAAVDTSIPVEDSATLAEEPEVSETAPTEAITTESEEPSALVDDEDDVVVANTAAPALTDYDDDDVTVSPGITGAPSVVAASSEETGGSLVDSFLGSIPEVGSRKEASVTVPATSDTDGGSDDSVVDLDDVIGSVLDMDDSSADLEETQIVSVDDGDVFGGLVESSVVTEQKPPKLVRDELQMEADRASSAKAAKVATKEPAAPSAAKAVAAKPAVAAKAPAVQEVKEQPKTASMTAAEDKDTLDKFMLDLGL